MKNLIALLVGIAVFASLTFTGYAKDPTKTINLGLDAALSGPMAGYGIPMKNGCELVTEIINGRGGLNIGGEKYQIVMIAEDNQNTPEGAAAVANRLVDKGVHLAFACMVTHTSLAAQQVFERAKVPTLNTASDDRVIAGKKYTFRAYMASTIYIPGEFNYLSKQRGVRTLAQMGGNTESSWFMADTNKKYADRIGMKVVYSEYFEPGTTDFYPFLTKMVAAKPDALFGLDCGHSEWALIMKQSRELGYTGLFVVGVPPEVPTLLEVASKDDIEGLIGVGYATSGPSAPAAAKEFVQKYTEKYGRFDQVSLVVTGPLFSVFQAIEDCGSIDPDKVAKELEAGKEYITPDLGEPGAWGGKEAFGRNAQWYGTQYMLEVQGGEVNPVYKIPMEELLHGWK